MRSLFSCPPSSSPSLPFLFGLSTVGSPALHVFLALSLQPQKLVNEGHENGKRWRERWLCDGACRWTAPTPVYFMRASRKGGRERQDHVPSFPNVLICTFVDGGCSDGGREDEAEGWLIVTCHSLLKQYDYDGKATGRREGGTERRGAMDHDSGKDGGRDGGLRL